MERAGKGVWHAGGAGDPGRTRGFQLWVALPPHLELGPSESFYRHRQLVFDGNEGGALGRAAAVDRRDYAAIATPVTSAQAMNA
jgi:redox-sensitive bicupin YhaK (pirin superfamily)